VTVSHLTFRVQDRQAEQDSLYEDAFKDSIPPPYFSCTGQTGRAGLSLRGRFRRQYPTFLFVYRTDRQSRTLSTRTHSKTVSHHLPFRVQDRQAEQDSLYEDAFDKMKRAAGVSNIDEVVQR
jgi:hypothetical protein